MLVQRASAPLSLLTASSTPVNTESCIFEAAAATPAPPRPVAASTLRTLAPILASAFSVAALMYPLDLVRALQMANAGSKLTTLELLKNFKDVHGVSGFFTQGLAPELARSTWMRFIKFGLFPIIHLAVSGLPEKLGTPYTKALAAIVSSIPEAISIMPLEISKIALQLDTKNLYKNNMFAAMADYYNKKGLAGFNLGYLGIQYRQASWSAAYFASLDFFQRQTNRFFDSIGGGEFKKRYPGLIKQLVTILSGFFAGVFGACLNTPGDTIRSTIQKRVLSKIMNPSAAVSSELATTFFGVGQEIVASKGIAGLYAGFQFKAFHLGGGGALMAVMIPFFTKLFAEKK